MKEASHEMENPAIHTECAIGRKEWAALATFLVLLFVFRLYNLQAYDVISADGTSYGPIGRAFFQTGSFKTFGVISGPVYSFLVGLFDLVLHNIELSLRLVSIVLSTATVAVIYLFARTLFGLSAAISAVLIASFLPFLHGMSGIDIIEPTFGFFMIAGTYLFWRACQTQHVVTAVGGGLLLGISYLSRSEGFICWFALMVVLVIVTVLKERSEGISSAKRVLLPFFIAFMLLCAPYLVYLHAETGVWQLSGKAGLNAQAIREYLGKATVDQKFKLDSSGGFDGGKRESLGRLFMETPELMKQNIINNVKQLPVAVKDAMTWYLLLATLAALVFMPWNSRFLLARATLAAVCAPIVIYLLFFVQPRGLYPYISFLCIWAGGGISLLERFSIQGLKRWGVPVVVSVLMCAYFLTQDFPHQKPPYDYLQDGGRQADKHIGLRLKSFLPKEAVIMTRSGRIGFYSERVYVLPPQESFEAILEYAQKSKVSHLVVTPQLIGMRPQLEFLFQPVANPAAQFVPPAGLKLVYTGQEPGGLPYLVYSIPSPTVRNSQ